MFEFDTFSPNVWCARFWMDLQKSTPLEWGQSRCRSDVCDILAACSFGCEFEIKILVCRTQCSRQMDFILMDPPKILEPGILVFNYLRAFLFRRQANRNDILNTSLIITQKYVVLGNLNKWFVLGFKGNNFWTGKYVTVLSLLSTSVHTEEFRNEQ